MAQPTECVSTQIFFNTDNMKLPRAFLASAWLLCLILTASAASTDSLETGFLNPPDSARPQTWWHWMNGNITKEGITADLEAMKQIGLGGATIINVDCGIPRGPVNFLSPEWRDDFKFAVQEASRLGLKLGVENCALDRQLRSLEHRDQRDAACHHER